MTIPASQPKATDRSGDDDPRSEVADDEAARMPPPHAWVFQFNIAADHATAKRMAEQTMGVIGLAVTELGLDLSRLDGVTIADDYPQALLDLDRGFEASQPLTPSEEFGIGMAMAAPVKHDGRAMARLMLHTSITEALISEAADDQIYALQVLVHELAHVHDLAKKDRALGGIWLNARAKDVLDHHLQEMTAHCWDEYFATRVSVVLRPASLDDFEAVLMEALAPLLERIPTARRAFFEHRDFGRALREMSEALATLLKFAAYVIGSADGLDPAGDGLGSNSRNLISNSRFAAIYQGLRDVLRDMFHLYPNWTSLEAYRPLCDLALRALEQEGLRLTLRPDGLLWIQIAEPEDFTLQERLLAYLELPVPLASRGRAHESEGPIRDGTH